MMIPMYRCAPEELVKSQSPSRCVLLASPEGGGVEEVPEPGIASAISKENYELVWPQRLWRVESGE